MRRETPNDSKLSDSRVRRGTCMVGGNVAVEAGAVTHGVVRSSAWLGVIGCVGVVIVNLDVLLEKLDCGLADSSGVVICVSTNSKWAEDRQPT